MAAPGRPTDTQESAEDDTDDSSKTRHDVTLFEPSTNATNAEQALVSTPPFSVPRPSSAPTKTAPIRSRSGRTRRRRSAWRAEIRRLFEEVDTRDAKIRALEAQATDDPDATIAELRHQAHRGRGRRAHVAFAPRR